MVETIADALLSLIEFGFALAEFPVRRSRGEVAVSDVFRAKRAITLVAVIRPLTNESPRFQMTVPAGTSLRVDLALPAPGHQPYLSFVDPIDRDMIPPEYRTRALLAGVWVEIPRRDLRSDFERPRLAIRLRKGR